MEPDSSKAAPNVEVERLQGVWAHSNNGTAACPDVRAILLREVFRGEAGESLNSRYVAQSKRDLVRAEEDVERES